MSNFLNPLGANTTISVSTTQTFPGAVTAGNTLFCVFRLGVSLAGAGTITVSDSVNGAWTRVNDNALPGNDGGGSGNTLDAWFCPNTGAGTPIVTFGATGTSGATLRFFMAELSTTVTDQTVLDWYNIFWDYGSLTGPTPTPLPTMYTPNSGNNAAITGWEAGSGGTAPITNNGSGSNPTSWINETDQASEKLWVDSATWTGTGAFLEKPATASGLSDSFTAFGIAFKKTAGTGLNFVQAIASAFDTSASSLTVANFKYNTTAGHGIAIWMYWDSGSGQTVSSITDNKTGNTYTAIGSPHVDASNVSWQMFYCSSLVQGGASHALTATFSAAVGYCRLVAHEINNAITLDQFSYTKSAASSAPTTASVTTTTNGQYIFGGIMDFTGTVGAQWFMENNELTSPTTPCCIPRNSNIGHNNLPSGISGASFPAYAAYYVQPTAGAVALGFKIIAGGNGPGTGLDASGTGDAVGIATFKVVPAGPNMTGTAAGTGTASGSMFALASSTGTAAGTGTASAVSSVPAFGQSPHVWFDPELLAVEWFDPELNIVAWYDYEFMDPQAGGVVNTTGSATGTGTAAGVGYARDSTTGTATGTGAATGVAAGVIATTGSASGAGAAAGVGLSVDLLTGSATGTGAAAGVGNALIPTVGAASGAGAAAGVGFSIASTTGTATGAGAASGSAVGIAGLTGTASGAGAASGIGFDADITTGTAAGTGAANGVGFSIASTTGSSAGTGTASGAGQALALVTGAASGVGTMTGLSDQGSTTGTLTGSGTANGSALAVAQMTGSSAGSGAASAVGIGIGATTGSATGTGTASGVSSSSSVVSTTGTATGTGTAAGAGFAAVQSTGSTSGFGVAAGVGVAAIPTIAAAAGLGTASGVGLTVVQTTGSASGSGVASGVGMAAAPTTGAATGGGVALAVAMSVAGVTGNASGLGQALGMLVDGNAAGGAAGFALNQPMIASMGAMTVR